MVSKASVFVLLLANAASASRFENDWDDSLEFTCDPMSGEGIYMIETDGNFGRKLSGKPNDRKWGFDCKSMGASTSQDGCKWYTGIDDGWINNGSWINNYQHKFEMQCPSNGIVAGFKSVHSNRYEDRIWNVYCCTGSHASAADCEWKSPEQDKKNDDDWKFEFSGEKAFIRGVRSWWGNGHDSNDRSWQFEVCQQRHCFAVEEQTPARTQVQATKGTREVNSVSTSLNCNSRNEIEFEEGPETIQTNSLEITDTQGQESTMTHSASISVGLKVETSGPEFAFQAGGSVEFTNSESTETSNTNTYSSSSTTYAVQFDWFSGPSAMMIMSESDTYSFSEKSYEITEYMQCEGEDEPKKVTRTVAISGKTYGQTHFTTRFAQFKGEKECLDNQETVEACLNTLKFMKGENKVIGKAFEHCFAKKDTSGNVLYQSDNPEIPQWLDGIVERGVTL